MSHLDYKQKTVPTGGVSESPNDAEAYIFVMSSSEIQSLNTEPLVTQNVLLDLVKMFSPNLRTGYKSPLQSIKQRGSRLFIETSAWEWNDIVCQQGELLWTCLSNIRDQRVSTTDLFETLTNSSRPVKVWNNLWAVVPKLFWHVTPFSQYKFLSVTWSQWPIKMCQLRHCYMLFNLNSIYIQVKDCLGLLLFYQ